MTLFKQINNQNKKASKITYAYIANRRMPSEMAHGVYVAKTVEATKDLGLDVFLLIPDRTQPHNFSEPDFWKYYGIKKNYFKLVKFPVPELLHLPFLVEVLVKHIRHQLITWYFAFRAALFLKKHQIKIIQTNDRELIMLLKIFSYYKPKIIYDMHADPRNSWEKFLDNLILERPDLIAANTGYFRDYYQKRGVYKEKIIVLPNGYDPRHYKKNYRKLIRKKFKITENEFVLGFIGRFETINQEKGIKTIIKAVELCPKDIPLTLFIIGGPASYINEYRKFCKKTGTANKRIRFGNQVKPYEVAGYIKAFDVACMLYPDADHFRNKMSPMKAIEYMAAGKPIIASNLPSIRRLINNKRGYLVEPGNELGLAKTIEKIYKNRKEADQKAKSGYKFVKNFTWINRQKQVIHKVI